MTPEEHKELEIVFAPGCFDTFEGTQEELDALVAEIKQLVQSGELIEQAIPLDFDELSDDELCMFAEALGEGNKRNLQ